MIDTHVGARIQLDAGTNACNPFPAIGTRPENMTKDVEAGRVFCGVVSEADRQVFDGVASNAAERALCGIRGEAESGAYPTT